LRSSCARLAAQIDELRKAGRVGERPDLDLVRRPQRPAGLTPQRATRGALRGLRRDRRERRVRRPAHEQGGRGGELVARAPADERGVSVVVPTAQIRDEPLVGRVGEPERTHDVGGVRCAHLEVAHRPEHVAERREALAQGRDLAGVEHLLVRREHVAQPAHRGPQPVDGVGGVDERGGQPFLDAPDVLGHHRGEQLARGVPGAVRGGRRR
jgi:hypothetical protein